MVVRSAFWVALVGASFFAANSTIWAQQGASGGEWHHYAGDQGSTKYSPLDQITRENAGELREAWRWESSDVDNEGKKVPGAGQFKCTPLMVGGVLYVSTSLSKVVALDAGTGATLWTHDPRSYEAGRPTNTGYQHRGVEYWRDGDDERIFIATGDRRLIALNAKTGIPIESFGVKGEVDLTEGLGRKINPRIIGFNAPPVVCRDTIVLGSIIFDAPVTPSMPPGHVRGYDVRTGKQKWIFHTIPQEGEVGVETWKNGSWKYSGNTNVWAMITADEELGYVYLPLSTPTNDWYGGHRLGNNVFAESLVCLDAETGERIWHFQAVHHGLWDYDFPCAPNLVDIVVDGKRIKAVAQVSKQAFCYVFDRATGEPVWPIEERPVPQSRVPGEETSPTQPFPTKPPAFDRQGVTEDDLIDFTPELRAEAVEILKGFHYGPLFTPPIVANENGKRGNIMMPGPAGGANWGGAAFDPETGILYVGSMTLPFAMAVAPPDAARSSFKYTQSGNPFVVGPKGLPLFKPPYGRITAIDLNKGEHVWQVSHGYGPHDHPALKELNLGPLGAAANGVFSNGGGVLTKTLFFIIQAKEAPGMMRMGPTGYIRAFDKTNGDLVWEQEVNRTPHGTPMTYMHKGKQYIVHAVGGMAQPAELIAYALP